MEQLLKKIQNNADCKVVGYVNSKGIPMNGSFKSLLIQEYMYMLGGHLYNNVIDDMTEDTMDRMALINLIDIVSRENIDVVVVLSMGDFSANIGDVYNMISVLHSLGCQVYEIVSGRLCGDSYVDYARGVAEELAKVF